MSDTYRLHTGLNYTPHGDAAAEDVRREAGDVVDDLDPASIGWLTDGDLITPAPGEQVTAPARAKERGARAARPAAAAADHDARATGPAADEEHDAKERPEGA